MNKIEKIKIKIRNSKGITLIALVITIIVLLILAGVSIAMLTGQNGILTQAQNASKQTDIGKEKEQIALAYNGAVTEKQSTDITADDLNDQFEANGTDATASGENPITVTFGEPSNRVYTIDSNGNITEGGSSQTPGGGTTGSTLDKVTGNEESNTTVYDSLGNKVVVPAGFKVYIPEGTDLEDYNVENGIIIEDVSAKDATTKGSQFVWIPTGTIHRKDKEDVTINLDRYTFASNGDATRQGTNEIDEYYGETCQELASSDYGNTTAINTDGKNGFLEKAASNATGGFYIGRYEARDGKATSARTGSTEDRQVVTKAGSFVYNFVTQIQAATLSRNMYSSSNFTSDLINSYAWDTALVFIQSCSGDDRYSQQNSLNNSLATTGTTEDVKCNIYDMASNCLEWSTETAKNESKPCVSRGSIYDYNGYLASTRCGVGMTFSYDSGSFRPLLYL